MSRALLTAADFKELPIPQGLGFWWDGTILTIPDGFEIADGTTSVLDPSYTKAGSLGVYFKACTLVDDSPGTTGGALTHLHNVPSHNSHSVSSVNAQGGDSRNDDQGTAKQIEPHSHSSVSGATDIFQSINHEPPHVQGIPIVYCMKGDSTRGLLTPNDLAGSALPHQKIVGWWGHTTPPPTAWAVCNGQTVNNITTPNWLGRYIKGIPTAGTDPGTTGGSSTHTHDASHGHGTGSDTNHHNNANESYGRSVEHQHTLASQSLTTDAGSNELPFKSTHYVCFTGYGTGGNAAHSRGLVVGAELATNVQLPRGLTALWGHPVAQLPSRLKVCDGGNWTNGQPSGMAATRPNRLGKYMKHVASAVDAGTIGGNTTHTHIPAGHVHVISGGTSTSNTPGSEGGGLWWGVYNHQHSSNSVSWAAQGNNGTDPPYITGAYVVVD
jgi:hypothetical protein